ncbi:hypothetical protein AAHB41_06035 [Pediococcus pentosaceus]|uniref:hypothetical protein n=1 Tax=Pediococcus pentosaceus TaxID=1255 RepID=UPI002FEE9754
MEITTIVMDVYKPGSELKNKVVDISDSFNARVGDNQVRLVIKYVERGIVGRMEQEQLTPFMMGFVGQPDEEQKVTAETGTAVSYHGSSEDIIGGGKVKMDLPGTMFPQEGAFYGFFGLENSDGKRVTTNNVFFRVENDNPDMYVDAVPFRTELQKLLDEAVSKSNSTVGEIQKSWETLKGTITTLLETGNSNLDAYLSRLKLAEDRLTQYEKDLAAGKGISQADLDSALTNLRESIKEGLEELNHQIAVDDNIKIGNDVTVENENAIVNIVSQLDPNNFNIGYITDNHGGICSWTTDYSDKYAYDHLNNFLKLDGNVDVMIAGGDNSDCYRPSDSAIVVDNRRFDTQFLFGTDNLSDKFILKGNHDDGSVRTNDYRRGTRKFESVPHVLRDSEFNKMIAADQLLFDEKRNNGKSYFYKDYPNKKVRVIGLNSNDTPDDILLDDGEPKYLGIWRMGYRQEQLNWLANVALQNVPEDYTTIIFSHIQANIPGYENDENTANHDTHRNQDILIQIIKDFMAGSSSSLTSGIKDYEINLKTNFVTQGKRDFAGYIHGHEHVEDVTTDLGFNNIGFFASYNVKGTYLGNTDAWQTISIDKTNRKLIIKGFGRATNRTFSY